METQKRTRKAGIKIFLTEEKFSSVKNIFSKVTDYGTFKKFYTYQREQEKLLKLKKEIEESGITL